MCFAATAFLTAVQQVADQIFVQAMLAAKFGNAFTLAIKNRAGLLGGLWSMHSVRPCLIVFDEKDSWSDFCSSQIILIKKLLISLGVGERLREERERLGKNQTDFGVSAGVSRGTQKAYELESSSPDVRYLSGLQALGVDVYYLLTGSRVDADANNMSDTELTVLGHMREMSDTDRATLAHLAFAMAQVSKPDNK